MAAAGGIGAALAVLIALSIAQAAGSRSKAVLQWRKHREEILKLPEELYHRDRFRAIRGRVSDEEGKPISGALVRCAKLESLVELARMGQPTLSKWAVPIEDETTTDDQGRYEFPHLSIGARTFFYSAPDRDLAPAIKDLIVVQDGLGAHLDVTLGRPAALHVRLKPPGSWAVRGSARVGRGSPDPAPPPTEGLPGKRRPSDPAPPPPPTRLHLIPQRWWPALMMAVVPPGGSSVEFRGLGGPFRKGLIATSGPSDSARLRVVGCYDLDQSAEAIVTGAGPPSEAGVGEVASLLDLPEAAGIESWRVPMRASHRLFYAAISPIALFWPAVGDDQPLWLIEPAYPLQSPPLLRSPDKTRAVARFSQLAQRFCQSF